MVGRPAGPAVPGTCYIFSLPENSRWSRVWQLEQNYELRTFEADLALVLTFTKKIYLITGPKLGGGGGVSGGSAKSQNFTFLF